MTANHPDEGLFDEAQRIVRWHYQWMVTHEYLPKVVGAKMAKVRRRYYRWRREPFIPVEFSGAAFRFGHSMARAQYNIRAKRPDELEQPKALSLFDHLKGNSWLAANRVLRWDLFFDLKPLGAELAAQPSLAIDTSIAAPLYKLPDGKGALPRLNLLRGRALSLPSGQSVATRMRARELGEDELLPDGDHRGPRPRPAAALHAALVLRPLRGGRDARGRTADPGLAPRPRGRPHRRRGPRRPARR